MLLISPTLSLPSAQITKIAHLAAHNTLTLSNNIQDTYLDTRNPSNNINDPYIVYFNPQITPSTNQNNLEKTCPPDTPIPKNTTQICI